MTPQCARWRLKSLASRLFAQTFVQAHIKENIKAQHHWPLWRESIGDRWIPSQRASNAENVFIWLRHYGTYVMLWKLNWPGSTMQKMKLCPKSVIFTLPSQGSTHLYEKFYVIYQMIVNITWLENSEINSTGIGLKASIKMEIYLNYVMYLLIHALISTEELHNYREIDEATFCCIYISTIDISWNFETYMFRFRLGYNLWNENSTLYFAFLPIPSMRCGFSWENMPVFIDFVRGCQEN